MTWDPTWGQGVAWAKVRAMTQGSSHALSLCLHLSQAGSEVGVAADEDRGSERPPGLGLRRRHRPSALAWRTGSGGDCRSPPLPPSPVLGHAGTARHLLRLSRAQPPAQHPRASPAQAEGSEREQRSSLCLLRPPPPCLPLAQKDPGPREPTSKSSPRPSAHTVRTASSRPSGLVFPSSKDGKAGDFPLVVWWLRPHASSAGGPGSLPSGN